MAKFGDPYEYVVKTPIKKLVVTDFKAKEFFVNYRFNESKTLPLEHIEKYTTAASWLNMLNKLNDDKKIIKNELQISLDRFYINVTEIIKAEEIDLPTSYRFLREKMKQYKEEGYACLIDWRFGNTLAKKVDDQVSESLLLELIAHPNQYNDDLIAFRYNHEYAVKNQKPTITKQTVGNYRRNNEHLIISQREGRAAFNDKFIIQAKRKRPSTPLFLCEHDDNHLDYYYIDIQDKTSHKHYHKYKAIVVIDSFNDLVLGYAYARSISNDLIRKAYLNAMYYIKQLTGGWYLPHEIKSDRFGSKELKPFYLSMGNYYDTPVGSKGRGYIEQFFGTTFFKNCMKIGANNYSGNNITAKTNGVNRELLDINKSLRPTVDEAPAQIEAFFHRLRNMTTKEGGISKQQEWLNAWNTTSDEYKKQISDETFLLIFGTVSNERTDGITITNRGVEPQIGNVQYSYDLPFNIISNYVGMKVKAVYDENNMDRVLLTNFNDFRCIATTTKYLASNMADTVKGGRSNLNELLSYKLMQVEYSANKATERKQILVENDLDVEALLQAGAVIPKLLKQQAEERSASSYVGRKELLDAHQSYLEQNHDFNKYTD